MAYYFSANIKIKDPDEYQKYIDRVDDIFSRFNGKYLAMDESPTVLEGKWNYSKSVLIEFPDKEDFKKWYYSDDYQEILKYRLAAADCDSILIQGPD